MTRYKDIPPGMRIQHTLAFMKSRSSDVKRWEDTENFPSTWHARAEAAARLIKGMSPVIDLGCGMMILERELEPSTHYIPVDLVARDGRTIVCDLNAGELPDVAARVVVMLGVLEYLHEPAQVLRAIARRWSKLILSYNAANHQVTKDRKSNGWFNNFGSAALVDVAAEAGFALDGVVPLGNERIYEFSASQ